MGDFNARIGKKEMDIEYCIGDFGHGVRNETGKELVNFAMRSNMYVMNTFFYKKPQHKWTWQHPNGVHKNEYDYIISNRKNIVQDVSVLNNFYTGSDHRLVRATLNINTRTERRKLTRRHIPQDIIHDLIRAKVKVKVKISLFV